MNFPLNNRHFAQTWYVLRKQLLLRKLIYLKTHQLKIALALPDSKPWGITRFFNGVNDYASSRKWLLTACPVNPESSDDFPLGLSRLKSWHIDEFSKPPMAGRMRGEWAGLTLMPFGNSWLARIFHNRVNQRSGGSVQRLESIEPNETIPHRFFFNRV
jgi:hypothetical protein